MRLIELALYLTRFSPSGERADRGLLPAFMRHCAKYGVPQSAVVT